TDLAFTTCEALSTYLDSLQAMTAKFGQLVRSDAISIQNKKGEVPNLAFCRPDGSIEAMDGNKVASNFVSIAKHLSQYESIFKTLKENTQKMLELGKQKKLPTVLLKNMHSLDSLLASWEMMRSENQLKTPNGAFYRLKNDQ